VRPAIINAKAIILEKQSRRSLVLVASFGIMARGKMPCFVDGMGTYRFSTCPDSTSSA
jgi:hypothetical protein